MEDKQATELRFELQYREAICSRKEELLSSDSGLSKPERDTAGGQA